MASKEPEPLIESVSHDLVREHTPRLDICVTANVRVIRYGTSLPSDESEDSKVAIVTTLSAVFKEPSTLDEKGSGKRLSVAVLAASYSENIVEQPLLRPSIKSTQLNTSTKHKEPILVKKKQIDRTVLLPYLGCTAKKTSLTITYKKTSSKSWDEITRSTEKVRRTDVVRSRSLNNTPKLMNVTDSQNLELTDSLLHSFRECEMIKYRSNMVNEPLIRSFYFIKDSNSDSQVLFSDEKNVKYLCTPIIDRLINTSADIPGKLSNKSALKANISGFEREILAPTYNFRAKTCRNVSILHRPRTRDKATSTTSLNKDIGIDQLNNSIKGLLMPYIAAGKDFPSELVLKLITKKEAIEIKPEKSDLKTESNRSSEADLLAPIINTPPKRKKKKGSIFVSCFSKSKKNDSDDLDNSSEDSLKKEVYYPSIVEVYNKKTKKPHKEIDNNASSSFGFEEKKKKSVLKK